MITGQTSEVARTGYNEGVGTAALFDGPFGLAFHWPSNSIFAQDAGNNVIRRIQ